MESKTRHIAGLAVGIALTLAYVLGAADAYETVMRFDDGFSDALYNYGLYTSFALITALVAWGAAAVYYYLINSVRFDRASHWLTVGMVAVVVSSAACLCHNSRVFAAEALAYADDSLRLLFCHALWAALLYVTASLAMRHWSSNCRHSPF